MDSILVFEEKYSDEALYDLERDVSEAIDPEFNKKVEGIPTDKHGFRKGVFHVTIVWRDEE